MTCGSPGAPRVAQGQSSAGKSTLLRCMNLPARADSGELQVAGIDAMLPRGERELRRRVAMIFQHHNVVSRLSVLKNVLTGRLGAIQVAIWGTLLGVIFAIPLALLAARNLRSNRWVYQGTRQLLNVIRSINELILALVFVSAVGLGPFPGVLALAVNGVGMRGQCFAESIEEIDQGPLEALRATGGSTVAGDHVRRVATGGHGVDRGDPATEKLCSSLRQILHQAAAR